MTVANLGIKWDDAWLIACKSIKEQLQDGMMLAKVKTPK